MSDTEIDLPLEYTPPSSTEKIKIPGRSEEEVKEIYRQKSAECNKKTRARNRQAKKSKKARKRMNFTTCFMDDYSVTEENAMKLRIGLAKVCAELNCCLKETCKPRYAMKLVDMNDFCKIEFTGNAKEEMEELLGREITG